MKLQKMNKGVRILMIVLLVGTLVGIRLFEDSLFYDPLIDFFKTDHTTKPLPEINTVKVLAHVGFRFLLNTLVSLGIIWTLFKDIGMLKLSMVLYGLLFISLILVFSFLLFSSETGNHMTLFYVRRFLIQPIFLLILLPAFYFQTKR